MPLAPSSPRRQAAWPVVRPARSPRPPRRRRNRLAAGLLALGGLLVLGHGCHKHEDNELFARLRALVDPAASQVHLP